MTSIRRLSKKNMLNLDYFIPMPLWHRQSNLPDEEYEKYKAEQWDKFIKTDRYRNYIVKKLKFEMDIFIKMYNYYMSYMKILLNISNKVNISKYMFVYNTITYII